MHVNFSLPAEGGVIRKLAEYDGRRVRMFALIMPSAFVRSNKAKCIQSQTTPPNLVRNSIRAGRTASKLIIPCPFVKNNVYTG